MSTKPVARKLLIKEGYRVLVVDEPDGYRETLGALPEGVTIQVSPGEPANFVQVFVTDMEGLKERLPRVRDSVKEGGLIWITYPRGPRSWPRRRGWT